MAQSVGASEGPAAPHVPVMPEETLAWLAIRPDGVYVDGTAGAGGHSALIAAQLNTGRLIALDRDPTAVALAAERLRPWPQAEVVHANYGEILEVLRLRDIAAVDGVLIDAGVSSMQLDQAERGFSFQQDSPLDMRMDQSAGESARDYLHQVQESELIRVLREYGDVGPVRRIVRAILQRRDQGRLETTRDLAAAVREGLAGNRAVPDETRPVFQAIRIAVNEEFRWLQEGLEQAIAALAPGGRLVALTFHSGEDRIVKTVLRDKARKRRSFLPDGRVAAVEAPMLRLLTPKPIVASEAEQKRNSRSRSAKLRAAERI